MHIRVRVSLLSCILWTYTGACPWYPDVFVDNRADLKHCLESKNIQSRTYYPAIHTQLSYQKDGDFDVATSVGSRGLWLPSAAYVDQSTVEYVSQRIQERSRGSCI